MRELARRYSVRRRTVHQALESAIPPPRKHPAERPAPVLGPYHELIDSWLLADQEAPRKQRHTAKRITDRLRSEHGANLSERTVREYVAARRRDVLTQIDAHVPQAHPPGYEAECDWGEATAVIGGRPSSRPTRAPPSSLACSAPKSRSTWSTASARTLALRWRDRVSNSRRRFRAPNSPTPMRPRDGGPGSGCRAPASLTTAAPPIVTT